MSSSLPLALLVAALGLLCASGTKDRTIEPFDMDAVEYADVPCILGSMYNELPSMQRAWRDELDPIESIFVDDEVLCAFTVGSTARCWPVRGRTFRETVRETPWIRRNILWHTFGRDSRTWCLQNRADGSIECLPRRQAGPAQPLRRWLTPNTTFWVGTHLCARNGAKITCRDQEHFVELSLPSPTTPIEVLDHSALCVRVGDQLECEWMDSRHEHLEIVESGGLTPRIERYFKQRPRCALVMTPALRLETVPARFWMPWRSEAERRSLFRVSPDPDFPERLEWRRIEQLLPKAQPGLASAASISARCTDRVSIAHEFWNTTRWRGFKPDTRLLAELFGRAAMLSVVATPTAPLEFSYVEDQRFINQARTPSLATRLTESLYIPD